MKQKTAEYLYRYLPEPLYAFLQDTWRFLKFKNYRILKKLQKRFVKENGNLVIAGPFAGMKYVPHVVGGATLPKLLGGYEYILHPYIEKIVQNQSISKIIDIGVAEGYYLNGLGLRKPEASLVGFDTDTRTLKFTKDMFNANQLKNELSLEGEATPKALARLIDAHTLIICDIEGAEEQVLSPSKCPELLKTPYILLETHDICNPGVSKKIKNWFRDTHNITEIPFEPAPRKFSSFFKNLSEEEYKAITQRRTDLNQVWFWMEKR